MVDSEIAKGVISEIVKDFTALQLGFKLRERVKFKAVPGKDCVEVDKITTVELVIATTVTVVAELLNPVTTSPTSRAVAADKVKVAPERLVGVLLNVEDVVVTGSSDTVTSYTPAPKLLKSVGSDKVGKPEDAGVCMMSPSRVQT